MILILTGSEDSMATASQVTALQTAMSSSAVAGETDVYSGTDHAFTFPDSPNYNATSDDRSWSATQRLLEEACAGRAATRRE